MIRNLTVLGITTVAVAVPTTASASVQTSSRTGQEGSYNQHAYTAKCNAPGPVLAPASARAARVGAATSRVVPPVTLPEGRCEYRINAADRSATYGDYYASPITFTLAPGQQRTGNLSVYLTHDPQEYEGTETYCACAEERVYNAAGTLIAINQVQATGDIIDLNWLS